MPKTYTLGHFKKRAQAKFYQREVIKQLIGLNSPLRKNYEETDFCSTVITQNGNKLQSRYCKHRWCRICNRISTAKLIKGYQPVLDKMKEKVFLTLTIPNVKGENLRQEIKKMNKTIKLIQDNRRKKKLKLIYGIRKLECTYNPDRNDYHPHFHFILDNWNTAAEVLQDWLKRYPDADIKGQDIREAHNPKELFKYFTKLTSKSKKDKFTHIKGEKKRDSYHYIEAIDIIFQSIKNLRIIQPLGGVKLVSEEIEEIEIQEVENIEERTGIWVFKRNDWVDLYTGELLTGFEPTTKQVLYSKKIRYLRDCVKT